MGADGGSIPTRVELVKTKKKDPKADKTLRYAKMIESAGCQMLVVHGRERWQRGHNTGLADWHKIKKVKESLKIPVFGNGNILEVDDAIRLCDEYGVDGFMVAEASLYNPYVLTGKNGRCDVVAKQYLNIVKDEVADTPIGYLRGHLFKILKPALNVHTDFRERLGTAHSVEVYEGIVDALGRMLEMDIENDEEWKNEVRKIDENIPGGRKYPHWVCQPYIRPPLIHDKRKIESLQIENSNAMQKSFTKENSVTKKDVKAKIDRHVKICQICPNVASETCESGYCRGCCKKQGTFTTCPAHAPKPKRPKKNDFDLDLSSSVASIEVKA